MEKENINKYLESLEKITYLEWYYLKNILDKYFDSEIKNTQLNVELKRNKTLEESIELSLPKSLKD